MASYRGHLGFSGLGAAAGIAALSAYTQIKDTQTLSIIFGLALVGSLLPDVDSDSGVPFFLSYGTFTLAATAVVTYHTLLTTQDPQQRVIIPLVAFALLWIIGGAIVKRFTRHRGIFHSLPVMGIAALATVFEASTLTIPPMEAALFGVAIGAGFLSHLILDELYSILKIRSYAFVPLPNKSFGTALKLWSKSKNASIISYIILLILLYLTLPVIKAFLGIIPPLSESLV